MTTVTTRRVPGEQGTWVFLFGDMLVFAVFFGTFLVERASAPEIFDAGRTTLHLDVGVINTLALLSSSLCVAVFLGALRAGSGALAARAVSAAIGFGLLFVALKIYEYVSLGTAGHGPGASDFYLYYFVLTGLHLFHVCVGLTVLVLLLTQTRRTDLHANRMALIEGGTCFWHLVDLLWIVLFPLLYLVSR
ncbi:cytochrome c oxidase subunit 3 family protein [soil metagenome]